MAFLGLFGRKRYERAGFALYTTAVQAARDPYVYAELQVPDTMDGRFDMVGLYVCLIIERLRADAPPGPALAQAVFDAMFSDMDHTLRELGVGDMSVGKKVKAMWEALHGRSQAYAVPLAAGDRAGLADALSRNVWREAAGPADHRATTLAAIALRERDNLQLQALSDLATGRVGLLPQSLAAA